MSVAQTSIEAFHSLSPAHYLQPKRQQISERARMAINGVCGRVDSLVAAGLLEEHGDRIDPHTHKRQKLLRLKRAD
jgi:hypothetical protein